LSQQAKPGLFHEACLYDSDTSLIDQCVPVMQQALADNDDVLLFATGRTCEVLTGALGADVDRLALVVDSGDRWHGLHSTLIAHMQALAPVFASGRRWCLLTEPAWIARPGGHEWHRFEAASNRHFSGYPCHCLCLHDVRRLSSNVLDDVRRTHPFIRDGRGSRPSGVFEAPESFVPAHEPFWGPVPSHAVARVATNAVTARRFAHQLVDQYGLEVRRDDLVLAVSELAANSLEAGCAPTVAAWRDEEFLVIEIADAGGGGIDPLAGYVPPVAMDESGRGLWLARALADDAAVRAVPGVGSAVRILFRIG
jgi:anti-sigma regulatory factor (Ser/Thr protein kinase)